MRSPLQSSLLSMIGTLDHETHSIEQSKRPNDDQCRSGDIDHCKIWNIYEYSLPQSQQEINVVAFYESRNSCRMQDQQALIPLAPLSQDKPMQDSSLIPFLARFDLKTS